MQETITLWEKIQVLLRFKNVKYHLSLTQVARAKKEWKYCDGIKSSPFKHFNIVIRNGQNISTDNWQNI